MMGERKAMAQGAVRRALAWFRERAKRLSDKRCVLGCDGFVDEVHRVVRSREGKAHRWFGSIGEFGAYLRSKGGKSCCCELVRQSVRAGGNMPIMAGALSRLGARVSCIGALGLPEPDPLFKKLLAGCELHSVAEPGRTVALEFDDGKVMLAEFDPIAAVDWRMVRARVGLARLRRLCRGADLVALVNWSEMARASDIWRGLADEVFSGRRQDATKTMFFDLADCSRHNDREIRTALRLIGRFTVHRRTVLGLNENEAMRLHAALAGRRHRWPGAARGGRLLAAKVKTDVLVIHPRDCALAWADGAACRVASSLAKKPVISTGGGDHFNAGFAAARLLDFDLASALALANAVAGFYVRNGFSPNPSQLAEYLRQLAGKSKILSTKSQGNPKH